MGYQHELMDCYEQIAPLTGRMLELARVGDWDGMMTLETQVRSCVERLKEITPVAALDASQLAQKQQLLRRILADDAEIRDLVTPQFARLSTLMGNLRRQQDINQAYDQ
ncbi:flagellar protein FliT [Collimonas sp. OK607]|uniref:flagellar protein FliT n=1 Tax=Collimonas sp. OK607 TaxID=1798194 RepID=UPI0008ED848F|nr:flagellar protein FliT [Collimonas sp. OK607]SFB22411.1 flagellar protein FliT [Collimonas sp. OK607]